MKGMEHKLKIHWDLGTDLENQAEENKAVVENLANEPIQWYKE